MMDVIGDQYSSISSFNFRNTVYRDSSNEAIPSPPPARLKICRNNSVLPTPPSSTRTSLDEPPPPLQKKPSQLPILHTKAVCAPSPLTPPGVPPSYEHIVNRVRRVLQGSDEGFTVHDVPFDVYERLDAQARLDADLAGWEGLRVDIHDGTLIVGYPTSPGHEIMSDIFHLLACAGRSYPTTEYQGSKITQCGTADVKLTCGHKAPDFSLYELKDTAESEADKDDNSTPTVVWEVGYSENVKKLALDAARHICLTRGRVLLVITIDIIHEDKKVNGGSRRLKEVKWAHWEMDYDACQEVDDKWDGELNVLEPERLEDVDESCVHPAPNAYRTVVDMGGTNYHVRAAKTVEYKMYPTAEVQSINILYQHLYRDPSKADAALPVFTISIADVMSVISSHEMIQQNQDSTKKRSASQALESMQAQLVRLKKKRHNTAAPL